MSLASDFVVIDSESDEDRPPKRGRGGARNRGGSRGKRDSSKKQAGRARSRRTCTRRRRADLTTDVILNESLNLLDETSLEPDVQFVNTVVTCDPVMTQTISAATSGALDFTNSAVSVSVTEPDQAANESDTICSTHTHKKTARRGLARKNVSSAEITSSSATSQTPATVPADRPGALTHHTSVYSECVAQGFKTFLQLASAEGSSSSTTRVEEKGQELSCQSRGEERVITEKLLPNKQPSEQELNSSSLEANECQTTQFANDEMGTVMETSFKIRSPTPPPETSRPHRVRGMNKKLTSALRALSQAKVSLDKKTPPRKKRGWRDSDVIVLEEVEDRADILVKVRYLTTVHRFSMKLTESFHHLTSKMSQELGEPEHRLSLYLRDRSLQSTETPQSVHLSVADIIECHCIQTNDEVTRPGNVIRLVIQCRNSKTRMAISANKRRPLSEVMHKYAEATGTDWTGLIFSFDGEDIDPQDTASKLEMEDDDVIDVVVS